MKTPFMDHYEPIAISHSYDEIVAKRNKYLSPSLKTFQAYNDPIVMEKGMGQLDMGCRGPAVPRPYGPEYLHQRRVSASIGGK